jgi:hypothetical protein
MTSATMAIVLVVLFMISSSSVVSRQSAIGAALGNRQSEIANSQRRRPISHVLRGRESQAASG